MDDEVLEEFLLEAREHVDGLDADLVLLERCPHDRDLLAGVFRHVHTIKGAAGFLALPTTGALAHAGESVLARLRDGELTADREIADALLALADALRALLDQIEETGADDAEHGPLLARLAALAERPTAGVQPATPPAPEPALSAQDVHLLTRPDGTVRVDTGTLDTLMNLTSELVLARNALVAATRTVDGGMLGSYVQRLARATTDLQAAVTETRMQPIGTLWQKLPRVVRDLAAALGKQARLELSGADTELDKAVLEAIRDPLTHLVRNAVDHGIEPPARRHAAGKAVEGVVSLRAFHEHGRVVLEVRDDGAGIDTDRLARALRAADPGRPLPTDRAELLAAVFAPGLSTAEAVTSVSGRGVGMDVVRSEVERIGGSVELASVDGGGTTVTISVPLTTAIMPALLVRAGACSYAVPQVHVAEIVAVDAGAAARIHDSAVLRHRGEALPLVDLAALLGAPPEHGSATGSKAVLVDGEVRYALAVEDVSDVAEIVVKPLPVELRRLGLYAAATVLDDGSVSLILDVVAVGKHAGAGGSPGQDAAHAPAPAADPTPQSRLLVVEAGGQRRALRLDHVVRLEDLAPSAVERSAGTEAVRYGDGLLPLVRLAPAASAPAGDPARLAVVVVRDGERTVGLVVDRIVDVVDGAALLEHPGADPAVACTAVVDGHLVDVLDVAFPTRGAEAVR